MDLAAVFGGLAPWVAALSGALILALGAAILFVSRRAYAVAFAVFCTLWGFQIVAGNLSTLAAPDARLRWALLFVVATIVLYAPLAYFAAIFPRRRGFFGRSDAGAALLLLPAGVGAIVLLARPQLFFAGFDAQGVALYGPLYGAYGALLFLSFAYAMWTLDRERRRAPNALEAGRTRLVLLALLVFVAYVSVKTLFLFAAPVPTIDTILLLGTALVGLGVSASIALGLARSSKRPGARALALVAVLVPAAAGVVGTFVGLNAAGLFRIVSVALLAYAVLRYELFDIDARVKRGLLAAAFVLALGIAALGLAQLAAAVLGAQGVAVNAARLVLVAGVGAAVVVSPRVARRLGALVLPRVDSAERLDARRLEVYEHALARTDGADETFLRDLRARLGVSDAEHALLARLHAGGRVVAGQPLRAGALVAERYRMERCLGEGSAGAVWLAEDEKQGGRIVVKVLQPRLARNAAAVRTFVREARVAGRLHHANVVRVLDHGDAGGAPFLAMEYLDGGSLEDELARGPLAPARAREVVADALRGLAHVHAHGVLHRDLKPGNILLTHEGRAKISDFGIALSEGVDDTHTGLEAPAPKGTLATMSPEAVRGLPLSPASDVYAMGAVLYRCLAGAHHLRFEGRTREAARSAILFEPPIPLPPGTDPALGAIALKALARDPAQRYASAEAMSAALQGVAPRIVA